MGICGTFMGSLALLARELGHTVSGCDANVYPPMSTQLENSGIQLKQGYLPGHLDDEPDLVLVGNALSRGNPMVETLLNRGISYTSGPQWFAEHVLKDRHVIAVSGTHGKTTTSSMLAWILKQQQLDPGYLIGGVPLDFSVSAKLGSSEFFVVEADEYDSAFFDKRSKFVHYRPRTAIINNLEYDHADIFPDLAAIQTQFHHMIRTIPAQGRIIAPANEPAIQETFSKGCWTPVESTGETTSSATWQFELLTPEGSHFHILHQGKKAASINWPLNGVHNVWNALSAIAASTQAGISIEDAARALCQFSGVKRRMETLACINGIQIYDDFAHHPTAIATTLQGLRAKVGDQRIIAVIEPRSNTMQAGIHKSTLAESTLAADQSLWLQPINMDWNLAENVCNSTQATSIYTNVNDIVKQLVSEAKTGDHLVIISNGSFDGLHKKLISALQQKHIKHD